MAILDAWGRPIQKAEVELAARRGLMLPAHAIFGNINAPEPGDLDYSAFVDTTEESKFGAGVEQASWTAGSQPNSPYSNLNPRFAHKNPISRLNTPVDTFGLMSVSMQYSQDNYIVSRAIRVKRNFALRDMQFLGSETTKSFYRDECRRLKVRNILSHAFRYYWTTGRVCVYWGDERPIQQLQILDPRSLIVKRILGKSMVFLVPDRRWKKILYEADLNGELTGYAAFLKKNLPRYWLKYIKEDKPIPLKEDSYALIENDLELFSVRGIDSPSNVPLQSIFPNLATMEMLMAGDFSVAWMMKHMIALISIGDPKSEKDYTPPDQNDLKKLEATFNRPDASMFAYVDPTVDFRWIAPDPGLLASEKFKTHIEAIEHCMGVPSVFSSSGEGGSFSSSTLSMKPFREEITYARDDMEDQLLAKLFPQMREGYTARKSGGKDPGVSWDLDCLKDDSVIKAELDGKYDRGGLSVRSYVNGKAESFDEEVKRKLDEIKMMEKTEGIFEPAYDAAHGTPDEVQNGRPNEGGPVKPEQAVKTRAPRPSRGA